MDSQVTRLRELLVRRVGGFFRNTVHDPGRTCSVCFAPSGGGSLCARCAEQRAIFGRRLAGQVLVLTYVRGRSVKGPIHQSAHTVRAYKLTPPARKCADDMALMVR